jgi:hypothetical protein
MSRPFEITCQIVCRACVSSVRVAADRSWRELTVEPGHPHRLLPRPDHRAVIRGTRELRPQRGAGIRGVRDQHADVGDEAGRERPRDVGDDALQLGVGRRAEQQREAAVGIHHRIGVPC